MTMGTVPILDFRGLRQSHPQGHGELGPPISQVIHLPGGIQNCNTSIYILYIILGTEFPDDLTVQYCTVPGTGTVLFPIRSFTVQ